MEMAPSEAADRLRQRLEAFHRTGEGDVVTAVEALQEAAAAVGADPGTPVAAQTWALLGALHQARATVTRAQQDVTALVLLMAGAYAIDPDSVPPQMRQSLEAIPGDQHRTAAVLSQIEAAFELSLTEHLPHVRRLVRQIVDYALPLVGADEVAALSDLHRVTAELLRVLRWTGHQNILPQTTVWFQGVRSRGGTSPRSKRCHVAAPRLLRVGRDRAGHHQ